MAKQDVELKFSLIDGVSRGLAQIQQGVSGLGAQLVKVNAAADLAGKAFGALGSIAGAFGDAVSGAASVEDALKRVSIITRATTEEQAALQTAVSDAVATTRFTAEEAAGALVLMAEDGFTASEAVQQLGTVLQFAQANAQSAATAAAGLGAVLDTFGAPATQLGALADSLTAVGVAAGAPVKVLQEGLAGVGVAADQAGLSINDTVAALGALARNGIEGGAAAKALGKILTDAENPASKLGKALDAAGLAGKSFNEIVAALSADANKATPVLAALGNKPAAALRALLADGGGALTEFNAIIDQSAGASKAAADALNETFLGALTRLQNQLVEARNQFLTPLLAPLAAEFESFSAKISAFTSYDQFKILSGQFADFVVNGVGALGDKLAQVDFNDLATKISNFATTAGDTFDNLKVIVEFTASSIRGIGKAVAFVAEQMAAFDAAFGRSDANWNRYNAAVERGTKGIDDHARKLRTLRESFVDASTEIPRTTKGVDAFGNSLDQLGTAATRANEDLRLVPEAAKLTEAGFSSLVQSTKQAEIGLAQLAVNRAAAALAALGSDAVESSAEFQRLKAEVAAAEENLRKLTASAGDAAKTNNDLANSANNAAGALQNQASAAEKSAGSTDRASEAANRAANRAAAVSVSLENMTQAFLQQAQAAAASSTSALDYARTWNRYMDTYRQQNEAIQQRLDIINKQNAAYSEESKIRARLEGQFGTSSSLIEELVQAELRLANAKKKTNDEAQRGVEVRAQEIAQVQQQIALAGGIGNQPTPKGTDTASTAAGKGSGDQSGGKGAVVNINVQGLPTDRDGWRSIVRDLIEPELRNLRALGK